MVVPCAQSASLNHLEERFVQAHREAKWAGGLTLAYSLAWVAALCWADSEIGISGLPHWFEWIGLLLPLLFMGLCWLMVRCIYRNLSLEA